MISVKNDNYLRAYQLPLSVCSRSEPVVT